MAVSVVVDGPVAISVDTGTSNALESLGYTENGVEITEQIYTSEVKGDENGGDQGPPIDIQYFGEVHIIRMLLTKWDPLVIAKIRAGLYGGTAGTPGTVGSLYFQGGLSWRLVLNATQNDRNYTRVVFSEPKELNKGSKHSKALIIAKAYKDGSGVLYNTTVT